MEKSEIRLEAIKALKDDKGVKAWLIPNELLFTESIENGDMFLTSYRIRNAYEILLNKLSVGEEVKEDKDILLVERFFEMMFYPPRNMSLTDIRSGRDPKVRMVKAYKEKRWTPNGRRDHEITLLLDDGKKVQIYPSEVITSFINIRDNIQELANSTI